jgi:hypothetical protein
LEQTLRAAAAQREAAERTLAHQARVNQAARVNFAGLRFDSEYQTAAPVQFDGALAAALELSLRFNSDLVVEYLFRTLDNDNGVPNEVDHCAGQAEYELVSEEAVRLAFDTGTWVCEWEGCVRGDTLELSYHIEEYFGLSCGPKCVREGEARLGFKQSPSGE